MAIEVRHNPERSRYELTLEDRLVGVADYWADGDTLVFPHTEIEPPLRGRGLGAELVRGALDDVRANGQRVVARCWYVAQFVDEHPDYRDLLVA
ncbi:MAG TPA: GNAT family N-acetyltransferase [Acidimicrobiia bacterium]